MAFKFAAILALLACTKADYVPTDIDLPYTEVFGYGSTIASSALAHGSVLSGYSPAAHLAEPLARASHLQVEAPLLNSFLTSTPLSYGGPGALPAGKTTLTKTLVSTPTYVTSHVSNRVHTHEPTNLINDHGYGYDKNVINAAGYYGAQSAPFGHVY
ncbi:uncharacterized protein LOC126556364 [Anopheles maculipalpis]|uniref:uncharacterized protein LOC126556364 n=1 Tax=Anopheles maculipalpis TaxID=1496333 RepID=UPI002158E275|nr:uncharacterized protein LOC126556364 [Anopheles maculipalpis]